MTHTPNLRITEIFHSLQGEARTVGIPTVFVRLTGCPLRCQYCDTTYAFSGGEMMSVDTICQAVSEFQCAYVTVTGGEPLAQPECLALMTQLCNDGHFVSLETSGALPIEEVDQRVTIVLDLKTPGSLECDRNREENIAFLKQADQVKFVICDHNDYEWAKAKMMQLDLPAKVDDILFSPSADQLAPEQLAGWILADRIAVRMQLQLHKLIWGDEPGR
jgi:7-carboxy-7-deazaguanine synthase